MRAYRNLATARAGGGPFLQNNVAGTTDDERPLTTDGVAAALELADELEGFVITAIYSSPYARALATITPLAERRGHRDPEGPLGPYSTKNQEEKARGHEELPAGQERGAKR